MFLHQNTANTWTSPDGLTFRIITSWQTRDGIHTYLVPNFSRELAVNSKFWRKTVSMYISISEVWYGEEAEQGGSYRRHLPLENLNDNVGTNRACENIWGNIKMSAKESLGQYKHKIFVWRRMCKCVQQQKQPIMLCGNRTQAILMLMNNVRNDLSTDFRNKGKNFWEVNLIHWKK
jgi:hypothetical protein